MKFNTKETPPFTLTSLDDGGVVGSWLCSGSSPGLPCPSQNGLTIRSEKLGELGHVRGFLKGSEVVLSGAGAKRLFGVGLLALKDAVTEPQQSAGDRDDRLFTADAAFEFFVDRLPSG